MSDAFDPDAYLTEKTGKPFDPDAYLASKKGGPTIQPAPEDNGTPSAGRSRILGFANGGTAGFVDEIGGVLGKALVPEGVHLTAEARRQAAEQGMDLPPDRSSYELTRDAVRREASAAKEAHPWDYGGGQVLGGAALAAVAPGGSARTIAQMARTGAVIGGINALGDSRADLSHGDVRGTIQDVAEGAGAGGLLAGAGGAVMRVAPAVARYVSGRMRDYAVTQGRRVLLNGSDQLVRKAATSAPAVEEAIRSGGIVPFGTNGGAVTRLGRITEDVGDAYGSTLDELATHGVQGADVAQTAGTLRNEGLRAGYNTSTDAVQGAYNDAASMLESRALAPGNAPGRLGLRQTENIKRSLQQKVPYGHLNANELNDAREQIASMVRQANEDAVEQAGQAAGRGSDVANLAETFVPQKQRLGRLIEARNAAERGAAAGAKRTGSGLMPDAHTAAEVLGGSISPVGMLAKPGVAILKGRLPSTLATGAYAGSRIAGALANPAQRLIQSEAARSMVGRESASLGGKFAQILQSARERGGPQAEAATHFVLSQKSQEYRKHLEEQANEQE